MKKKEHVSLKDLAEELNVSISTVSRALKESSEIGLELKTKIKALAKERNYRPNPFAMSLLKNSPHIIGIIVPDIVTHFYASIISGISDYARQRGYSVIITSSYEQYANEIECLNSLTNLRVEGIVACISQETKDVSHFEALQYSQIPLVFFDRTCLTETYSSVVADNADSAKNATEHLLNSGSKRIAFIGGSNHLDIVKQRKHGYLEALRHHHLPIEPQLVICKEMSTAQGRESCRKLLQLPSPPDAILAMNDTLAFAAMKEIKKHHLRIPQDIALIGYTDEAHANYVEPALTAVTHQSYEMGQRACKLLFSQIDDDQTICRQVIIPTHLVIRASSVKQS